MSSSVGERRARFLAVLRAGSIRSPSLRDNRLDDEDCCGTDQRHVGEICAAWLAAGERPARHAR